MAYAQELKNLVAEIKTGHNQRTARIGEIKEETQNILRGADDYMRSVAADLKNMAKDLKDFLAKSEETRKKDFNAMMGGIQAKIKEIRGDVKNLLAKSEEQRMAGFKALMSDIRGDIIQIQKSVKDLTKSTQNLLGGYTAERKEAARYWASLTKEAASAVEAAAKKRGRPKK